MGVSRSPAELAGKFARLGVELSDPRVPLFEVGLAGKDVFLRELKRKGVNGTTKVSRGVKARFDLGGPNSVTIRYTGKAHLLNNPTGRHFIVPKAFGGSRRRRQRAAAFMEFVAGATGARGRGGGAIAIPGIGPRPYARHPGTKGLKFFEAAKKASSQKLPEVYARAGLTAPIKRAFK